MFRSCSRWCWWWWCAVLVSVSAVPLGPQHAPTRGAVWPRPLRQVSHHTYYKYDPARFNVTVAAHTCDVLARALERYAFVVRDAQRLADRLAAGERGGAGRGRGGQRRRRSPPLTNSTDDKCAGYLQELRVELAAPCESDPYLGMDESYNLTVSRAAVLRSGSLWGALRGLETWAQLFYLADGDADIRINSTRIEDSPRYPHRGLLLDTARHYISVAQILKTLDAMAMNKMNVLHWHIVDDQSFPYRSDKFPDLSRLGAFHRSLVYSPRAVSAVVSYARDRGVRVLPEFDVPGHTRSWGAAYPDMLTSCYSDGAPSGLGPMNPLHNATYKLLQDLFGELQDLFPDKYFHVGGDEVDLDCWESNPELVAYMQAHHMPSAAKLHALFMQNVIPLLGERSLPVVWQEVFDEGVPLPNDTLVQVWKNGEAYEMVTILRAGYKVLFSSAWYLDHLQSGGGWEDMYRADPRRLVQRYAADLDLERVAGGEACMWGEVVDDTNVISRVWPRASAVAERLWSPEDGGGGGGGFAAIPEEVYRRLEEHACRMNRRGVRAQPPSGPGFCLGAV